MHSGRTVLVVGVACTMPDEGCTQTRGDALGGETVDGQGGSSGRAERGQGKQAGEQRSGSTVMGVLVGGGFSDHF